MSPLSDLFRRAASAMDEAPPPAAPSPPEAAGEGIDGDLAWEALSTVIDPEIGLDIVTLGLVYDVEIIEEAVRVTFTLTTSGCPMQEVITQGIVAAASAVPGVESVLANLVWEPRWHSGMIGEGAW
jgi:metal-sulfur cluster biosynthetic enzyme